MNHIKMLDRRLPFEFVYETLREMSSLFTPPCRNRLI